MDVSFSIEDNIWRISTYESLTDVVPLESVGASPPIAEIYLNVDFTTT